jgi:outer membrane lipase/esterase
MATNWLRRTWLLVACASTLVLAACGGGSVESQLNPSRIIGFGDAFSDVGQSGSRYTINDGSVNIWAQQVAGRYGQSLTPVASGGLSYARGNARVVAKPDAAGNASTLTVKEQIDAYLSSGSFGANDMVVMGAGTADVIAEVQSMLAGAQTRDQMIADVGQAGRDYGGQVRRLVEAGAKHVVVVGPYNLGRSPWATVTGVVSAVEEASSKFNQEMLVSIVDLGASVLYVDAALYFNLVTSTPSAYSLANAIDPICTSVDPGPGNGTGAGQINAALCTPSTLAAGQDPALFLFADRVYPTPQGHRLFGDYAYDRIRDRW